MKLKNVLLKELLGAPADEGNPAPADPAPADTSATDPAPVEPAPADTGAAPVDTGPDLSFIGEDFQTDGKPDLGKFTEHYQSLLAEKAQRDEALADVPEDGNYEFALPEGFESGIDLPEEFVPKINVDDEAMQPLFGELGSFLKENNLPKSAAGQVMGLLHKYEATKIQRGLEASKAEFETLGANDAARKARVATVQRSLAARLPPESAKSLEAATTSAAGIKALEKLLQPRSISTPKDPQPAEGFEGKFGSSRLAAINRSKTG